MARLLSSLLSQNIHKPLFIEEPLLPGHVDGVAGLRMGCSVPIALGESIDELDSFLFGFVFFPLSSRFALSI